MNDCAMSASGGKYPSRRNNKSEDKQLANHYVIRMFELQGLGRMERTSKILILDTPALITTRLLSERYKHEITIIIIVEQDPEVARRIRASARKHAADLAPVVVVTDEVIHYLSGVDFVIDFIWLDVMKTQLFGVSEILGALEHMRCLAVTVTNRLRSRGDTGAARTKRMAELLKPVFKYKVLDWGYHGSHKKASGELARGTTMQVIAFGKQFTECVYRPKKIFRIRDCPNYVDVSFFGYPGERIEMKGTFDEWMYGMDDI